MLEIIDGRGQLTPVHIPRPRPIAGATAPEDVVRAIVNDVRARGDAALIEHTKRLDGAALAPGTIRVEEAVVARARSLVRPELIDALEVMTERLRATSERGMPRTWMETAIEGEMVGELVRPLRRVGIYAPGGRAAYPSSVIMAAVPARVAGVEEVVVCSPPGPGGEISEQVLAACAVASVTEVYRIGGAQAIAALAYGTDSVRPVEKIVGPGNVYVSIAKRMVQGWAGIDGETGPTETAIVADALADAEMVAADLIAQSEHGPLGLHVLITWEPELAQGVIRSLDTQVPMHHRADDVESSLVEGGRAVLVRDRDHALQTLNALAPEHAALCFDGAHDALDDVRNAGAIFLGGLSPVSAGDYVAGTNHILPTGGSARWASGLGVADFMKRIYVCRLDEAALERLAPHVDSLAEAEGLPAHARAVRMRLER